MSKSWLLVNSNFLLEWAAVHWLQFAQQAETTDVHWWLPAGTAQALQHPWALLGKQGWSPPVWFTAVWWAHTVSLLLPHPSLTTVTKENKPHTELNRPQGSPKADLEDVLLFQLTLIAAPSIQLLHVSFAVITSKALKNILYLSEHRSKKTKTKPHLRGFPTYKTEYDSDFYSQSTFLLSKVLKVIISSLNSALFAFWHW